MGVLRWQSGVDFLVLALVIYLMLRWSKEARALRVSIGILALYVGAQLAARFHLIITSWLLQAAALVALVLLLVVFQPELRHALARLDVLVRVLPRPGALAEAALREISRAASFSGSGAPRRADCHRPPR